MYADTLMKYGGRLVCCGVSGTVVQLCTYIDFIAHDIIFILGTLTMVLQKSDQGKKNHNTTETKKDHEYILKNGFQSMGHGGDVLNRIGILEHFRDNTRSSM